MATSYGDLYYQMINGNKTVVSKSGTQYSTPEQLAGDLGVAPSQIQWGNIANAPPPTTVGTGFGTVGTRQSTVSPGTTEYFNTQTQQGFATPQELSSYVNQTYQGANTNAQNVFEVLNQGYTTPNSDDLAKANTEYTPPEATGLNANETMINSANANLETARAAFEAENQRQLEAAQAEADAAQAKADEYAKTQENILTENVQPLTSPFREDLENAERKRLYINENFEANQKLTNELETLLNEGNALITNTKNQTIPMNFIDSQVTKTMSDINARAGVIEAVMAARNGQISQAYNLIDRSVAAITADRNDQLKYYSSLYDFYQNQKDTENQKVISLTNTEQKFIDNKISMLQTDLQSARASADYIKNLMVSPESAKFMADAGITLNDSVETINKKMAAQTLKVQTEEQQKADRVAIANANIKTQFVNDAGTIKRSSDGYAFTSEQDFQAKTGMTVAQAQAAGMITPFAGIGTTEWSAPYLMGGDWVQKNLKTGEIRTAVNVTGKGPTPTGGITAYDSLLQDALNNNLSPSEAALYAIKSLEAQGLSLSIDERNDIVRRSQELTPVKAAETPATTPPAGPPKTPEQIGQGLGKVIQNLPGAVTNAVTTPPPGFKEYVAPFFKGLFGF